MNGVWSPKPGSVTEGGSVIDYRGTMHGVGPCFVPRNFGVTDPERRGRRIDIIGRFGWFYAPAKDWPGIPPTNDLVCIVRRERK